MDNPFVLSHEFTDDGKLWIRPETATLGTHRDVLVTPAVLEHLKKYKNPSQEAMTTCFWMVSLVTRESKRKLTEYLFDGQASAVVAGYLGLDEHCEDCKEIEIIEKSGSTIVQMATRGETKVNDMSG